MSYTTTIFGVSLFNLQLTCYIPSIETLVRLYELIYYFFKAYNDVALAGST